MQWLTPGLDSVAAEYQDGTPDETGTRTLPWPHPESQGIVCTAGCDLDQEKSWQQQIERIQQADKRNVKPHTSVQMKAYRETDLTRVAVKQRSQGRQKMRLLLTCDT